MCFVVQLACPGCLDDAGLSAARAVATLLRCCPWAHGFALLRAHLQFSLSRPSRSLLS
jgi:hypothetical protein